MRYGTELGALLQSRSLTAMVAADVARAAAGERVRSLLREGKGSDMARSAWLVALTGVAFVFVSTMTRVPHGVWLWLNGGFLLAVASVAFVQARRRSWLIGFGSAAIGSAAFAAALVGWVGAARSSLVQLPFDHFDVERAGSLDAYLSGNGFSEFALAVAAGLVVTLVVLAMVAGGGALSRPARAARNGLQ